MCKKIKFVIFFCCFFPLVGCASGTVSNGGQMQMYPWPGQEADWIRNGEPIEFDGKLWYPQRGTENLLDSEVYLSGEYRGVKFFVEKIDVKPYTDSIPNSAATVSGILK